MKAIKLNVSLQDIPYAKEDRLQRDVFSLETRRSSIFQRREDGFMESVKQVELEICYLQREIEIRRNRKAAHADFMQKKAKNRANRARRY